MRSTTISPAGRAIRRRLIWAASIIVGLNLANVVAGALDRSEVVPGPAGSTYATTPDGAAAWMELLEAVGIATSRLERPLTPGILDPASTLVILDPGFNQLAETEIEELTRFLDQGGRLIIGGRVLGSMLSGLLEDPPEQGLVGPIESSVWAPVGETVVAERVVSSGFGHYSDPRGALPILGADGQATVLLHPVGRGMMVMLADGGLVANANLGKADNAVLAVALVGNRPVVFDEHVHGYGESGLFGSLPRRWRWALALLAAAVVVWMVAIGRRLGPPEHETRPLPPERRRYVESLGALLARARQPAAATAPVRNAARRRLAQRAGLPADASPEALRAAAGQFGLEPDEIAAILHTPSTDEDLLAADRALAKITRGEA